MGPAGVTVGPGPRAVRRRPGRLAAATVLVPLGAFVASAVAAGPASAAESPRTALRHAAEKALAEKSAEISVSISVGVKGTSVTISKSSGAQTFTSPLEATLTQTVVAGTTGRTESIPEVIVGTAIYVQVDGSWYSTTAQHVESEEGVSGSFQNSVNPAQALAFLYQEGATVTLVGRRTLDSAAMTEYHSTVSLSEKLSAPDGLSFTPQGLAQYKRLTGGTPLSIDVWVDTSGVVRREVVHVALSRAGLKSLGITGAPRGTGMTVTVGLSNFGVPVTATAPATATPLRSSGGSSSS